MARRGIAQRRDGTAALTFGARGTQAPQDGPGGTQAPQDGARGTRTPPVGASGMARRLTIEATVLLTAPR